ncbi:MAG: protein kinase [Holophagales bacterium]|nr:MAG: protein kinase [Holophagales bacterium]
MTERPSTETVGSLLEPPGLPPPLPVGALLAGRYRLGEVLGAGGYGVVYRAVDQESGRGIAVKALRAERLSRASRQRLAREAALLVGLAHPHLVRVDGAGESDGVAFLTMELVEGEPLRERLLREPLPVADAVRVAREVLSGLAVLHARGIVHRDVKPGNVLIDGEGRAKLADFGLVRRFDADATRATSSLAVVGTAEYLSPEQALGEEIDGRSDLYALGVTLFEMLAGKPVHERRSTFATVLARLNEPAPDVRDLRPEVPAWLAEVVGRLLEKEPDRRYATAEEVLADLEGERIPRTVLRRKLLRRGAIVTASSLLVAVAIAGLAWMRWRAGFDHMTIVGDDALAAVDRSGRELWRRTDVALADNFVPVRLQPHGPMRLAALLGPPGKYDPESRRHLAFLDPQTGAVAEEAILADLSTVFAEMSNSYGTRLRAFDLDGDGVDEIVATSTHSIGWPSFTVLYEPRLRRGRPILVAGGHHYPMATADVDDDGRPELIFQGTANRMGWYSALAAVRFSPRIGEPAAPLVGVEAASTPEESRVVSATSLAWYALLPRGFMTKSRPAVEVDAAQRTIRVHYQDGRDLAVGFDGFLREDETSSVPAAERERDRVAAYEALRQVRKLESTAAFGEARREAERASELARRAGDRILGEWASRVVLRVAIAGGATGEAESRAEALRARAEAPAEIAYDVARAFHLRGELARAADWYQRGISAGSNELVGRKSWEFLEGASLALAEQGRWEEVAAIATRRGEGVPGERILCDLLVAWAELHRGRELRRQDVPFVAWDTSGSPDFFRWLAFELRLALGDDPKALLDELSRDRQLASETVFALRSTEAEALARLGRWDEAHRAASEAVALAERDRERSVHARALLGELRAREVRIARRAVATKE